MPMRQGLLLLFVTTSLFLSDLPIFQSTIDWYLSYTAQSEVKEVIYKHEDVTCSEEAPLVANVCAYTDSLALVAIYNATNGPGWSNSWNLGDPMSTWFGLTLNAQGCVEELKLNTNNLNGSLPADIGNLSSIELLHLDNNNLSGSIPPEIGFLSNLQVLFLDDCNFSGSIPEEMGMMSSMHTFFLDNNNISGDVPMTFQNLGNLQNFEFFNNEVEFLPDLSALPLQFKKLKTQNNRLTFDDLLPNVGNALWDYYVPQDSVYREETIAINAGTYYEIDLEIDAAITTSTYTWYKNGAFFRTTTDNKLVFDYIGPADSGVYTCDITNPMAPLLTLHSRPVTLVVSCVTLVGQVTDEICSGESVTYGGQTFNEANPIGSVPFPGGSVLTCDSLLEVTVTVIPEVVEFLDTVLCQGESIIVNGTTYDASFSNGSEVMTGPNTCDSTIIVSLSFLSTPVGTFEEVYCPGQSVTINGTLYNETNLTGSETFDNGSYLGCDSILNVNISYNPVATGTYMATLCQDETVTIGTSIYGFSTPNGVETLQTAEGCDSTVTVSLSFHPTPLGSFNPTLCDGESITYNGVVYNQANPTGQTIIPDASPEGCDSTINVSVNFLAPVTGLENSTLCEGQSITINGNIYNQANPTGVEVLPNASALGCDSTVTIDLSFSSAVINPISDTFCAGGSVTINGIMYDETNPTDTLFFASGSVSGCDSFIYINLSFNAPAIGSLTQTLCEDESVTIGSSVFDINNPTGTATLNNATPAGCDSTVNVNLSFHPTAIGTYTPTICEGDTVFVGTTAFHQNSPSGTVILANESLYSCDSTVNVNVSFYTPAESNEMITLCQRDSFIYDGIIYTEENTGGSTTIGVVLENANYNGCDSIVYTQLEFAPPIEYDLNQMLCTNGSIVINGTVYDENNMTGTEILENASALGCDSIVNVSLTFASVVINNVNPTLCEGESLMIEGIVYDVNNPTDTISLPNAAASGCDSSIYINLSYELPASGNYTDVLCVGESVMINGVLYDEGNSSGVETLANATPNGCDSTLTISLSFYEATGELTPTLCSGESLTIEGVVIDEDNPTETILIPNAGLYGCDSTLVVSANFQDAIEGAFEPTLCIGDNIIVNGTIYDQDNPTGQETLTNGSVNGCDSIVNVSLSFSTSVMALLNPIVCEGESIDINGVTFDENNLTDTLMIAGGSASGCDSTVFVSLSFYTPPTGNYSETICEGDSIVINGTTYDETNTTGTEVLPNASLVNGCDSILNISINFFAPAVGTYTNTICEGESEIINGTTYDANNTNGTEILENASLVNGCDSILNVSISFFAPIEENYNETLCPGESVVINGITYDENNSTGTEVFENVTINGCDSTLNITIDYYPPATGNYIETICDDETIIINGTEYGANNPSGTEIFTNASLNGCDSTLMIKLNFFAPSEGMLEGDYCLDQSVTINGTIYDKDNPSGSEVFPNASANGCDSTLMINLNFMENVTGTLEASICEGESYTLNNSTYSTSGTYDETIVGGSVMGCDSIVTLFLTVESPTTIGLAEAGEDTEECNTTTSLSGNLPPNTTGVWTTASTGFIFDNTDANSQVSGLSEGNNTFVWTLSTELCSNYDSDTVTLVMLNLPDAIDDNISLTYQELSEPFSVFENDDLNEVEDWSLNITAQPDAGGSLQEQNIGEFIYTPIQGFSGPMVFQYNLCNELCASLCDTANVFVDVPDNVDDSVDIPNGITPNGDGVNDAFVISQLVENPDLYPDNELVIFNRWGDVVYSAKPYNNDWEGKNDNGSNLPLGTYYFVLRLDIAEGIIHRGDITILK